MLLVPRRHVLGKAEICGAQSSWGHGDKGSAPSQPLVGAALTCQLQLGVLRSTQEDVLRLQVQVGDVAVVEELEGAGWAGEWARDGTALHPKRPGKGEPGRVVSPSCCRKIRATFSGRSRRVRMKRDRSPPAQNSMIR